MTDEERQQMVTLLTRGYKLDGVVVVHWTEHTIGISSACKEGGDFEPVHQLTEVIVQTLEEAGIMGKVH